MGAASGQGGSERASVRLLGGLPGYWGGCRRLGGLGLVPLPGQQCWAWARCRWVPLNVRQQQQEAVGQLGPRQRVLLQGHLSGAPPWSPHMQPCSVLTVRVGKWA